MSDLSSRRRAAIDSSKLPQRDLYEEGLSEVRRATGALPPPPASRKKEVVRPTPTPTPELEELNVYDSYDIPDDSVVPTREEFPELAALPTHSAPLQNTLRAPTPPPPPRLNHLRGNTLPGYSPAAPADKSPELQPHNQELEGMISSALARSAAPEVSSRATTRTNTIPPPPFNPLRQPTPSGYPPLPPAEARPSYPNAAHEESGRRQKIAEPATVDHVRAAAHGTSAEISQLRDEIKQHITDEFTNLRKYAPLRPAFHAPPSRTSWLASIGRGAVEKVKGWWGSLTGGSAKNADRPKEEPGLGETIRLLEQAERDARDLPTMFLTGLLDRSALQTSKERWEGTVANLQARKPSATVNVERRKSNVMGEKGLALQALLESDRGALHGRISPERGRDLQVIHEQLPKYIHTLNALRVSRDEDKKAAAEQALQGLKSVAGGVSINDLVTRAILTCEAAIRLPLADIDTPEKKSLSNEYAQRLERMQKALGLRGELKESLLRIKRDLDTLAPRTELRKTGTDN